MTKADLLKANRRLQRENYKRGREIDSMRLSIESLTNQVEQAHRLLLKAEPTGERLPFEFDVEAGPHGTGLKAVKGTVFVSGMANDDENQLVLGKLGACQIDIYETLSGHKAPKQITSGKKKHRTERSI